MALPKASLVLYILVSINALFLVSLSEADNPKPLPYSQPFNRTSFPKGFVEPAQLLTRYMYMNTVHIETKGTAFEDGKGSNIWDTFTRQQPGKIADRSNGDVANDFYHRYKEDIQLMKKVGLDSFRFSISWSRVLPKGKLSGGVNRLGVKFYNDLINELIKNDIKPFVTLFHFDTPQALEDEYKSWLSPKIVKDFYDYADFCFKTFGDRVKHWVTLNEPNGFSMNGYNYGSFPPGRCSSYVGNCTAGNSATEPYIAAHNLLLSHAAAVKLYREKYKPYQKGNIGITIVTHWYEPKSKTAASVKAAARALDFLFGWFAHPVTYGHYPMSMQLAVGDRLPKFSKAESDLLKGSMDFLGLNYYTTNYADAAPLTSTPNKSFEVDRSTHLTTSRNGVPIGTPTALSWLFIYPKEFWQLLTHIKEKYNDPIIYITENGMADKGSLSVSEGTQDSLRIRYHHAHLSHLLNAIKDGVKVKGYYVWTFWDDFEWDAGYTVCFGIIYIDYKNNLKRHLKSSAYWFKKFLLN